MLQYNREEPSPTLAEIIEIENREAREKGIKEGIKEGIEEGAQLEKEQFVLRLVAKNMDLEMVAEVTDLSLTEVREIISKHQ